MKTLHKHSPVMHETGKNRLCHLRVEPVRVIDLGNIIPVLTSIEHLKPEVTLKPKKFGCSGVVLHGLNLSRMRSG
jgi:hypothetical protein